MERTKDPMTKFRTVIRGQNSKGGDRTQLYLSTEEAVAMIETMQSHLENPKGIKIDLHVSKKEHEGRTFDSAIAFVKAVAEGGFGGGQRSQAPKQVTSNEEELKAKIAKLKNSANRTG